ncbi:MAG: Digeranylgeranylglycerophospholipid reductase [Methanonatronarchaeales archaeon]|nr:Digeranylgeranylglycerophospholipid reductase [Methanonatronarchaeales archaeon]
MEVGVVGGSIAGLEFARSLKGLDRSADIAVFEEHDEIGLPVKCAEGWLNVHGSGRPFEEAVENEVSGIRLHFRGAPEGYREVWLGSRRGIPIIDRSRNETLLAESCEDYGVRVVTGKRATISGLRDGFDLVVDASGCPSQSWRESGGGEPGWSRGVQYLVEGDFSDYEDEMLLEFGPDLVGYRWIFPKSEVEANVGLGWSTVRGPDDPWGVLGEFLERRVEGVEVRGQTAGVIGTVPAEPLYVPGNGVAKVGDAAGLADPSNGEGMSSAVVSARLLAEAVYSGTLPRYERRVKEVLGPQLRNSRFLRRVWETADYETFARVFNRLDGVDVESFFEEPRSLRARAMGNPWLSAKVAAALTAGWLNRRL